MCLWKLKSLSKITPRLRTLSDGDILLSSNVTVGLVQILLICGQIAESHIIAYTLFITPFPSSVEIQ